MTASRLNTWVLSTVLASVARPHSLVVSKNTVHAPVESGKISSLDFPASDTLMSFFSRKSWGRLGLDISEAKDGLFEVTSDGKTVFDRATRTAADKVPGNLAYKLMVRSRGAAKWGETREFGDKAPTDEKAKTAPAELRDLPTRYKVDHTQSAVPTWADSYRAVVETLPEEKIKIVRMAPAGIEHYYSRDRVRMWLCRCGLRGLVGS